MTALRFVLRPFLVVLAALFLAVPAYPDDFETVFLDKAEGLPSSQRVRARVLGTPASTRKGGYGYALVELTNPTERAKTIRMTVVPAWFWVGRGDEAVRRHSKTQRLEPWERSRIYLPLVNTQHGSEISFEVNGVPRGGSADITLGRRSGGSDIGVLTIWGADGTRDANWKAWLEAQIGTGGRRREQVAYVSRRPEHLPDRWVLLSGFDLVVVDMGSEGLTTERQAVLRRYVAGGGNLIVLGGAGGHGGPLSDLYDADDGVASDEPREGFHGLGRWIAFKDRGSFDGMQDWLTERGRKGGSYAVLAAPARHQSGGLPASFWVPLEIPGLGKVPVKAFFFLLLGFVVLVGPLNYLYFRKRRRLPMLLISIPAMGFACTLIILLYGLYSEGFGIIGATRSFSVLDQRDHTASVCTGRTLYAGLQPSALTPIPDSFFCSLSFNLDGSSRDLSSMFRVDLDGGYHVEGSALPSRTPMPYTTVSVGRARARLRFRRRPDDGFDVLAAPDFTPLRAPAAVLLRTFDGAYYVMDEQGVLQPRDLRPSDGATLIERVLSPLRTMPVGGLEASEERYYYGRHVSNWNTAAEVAAMQSGAFALVNWMARRLPSIPKGSYLARMVQPPVRDDFGLEIDYRAARHVVHGLLAEEDVLDGRDDRDD